MEKTKRNWAYIFSPYIVMMMLLAGECIYARLFAEDKDRWDFLVFIFDLLMPIIIIALAIDMFLKAILRRSQDKSMYIWTIELMLTGLIIITIFFFPG